MAISVDPATFIIHIPKADLTLVQSTPIEIRELNLNNFRLNLKAWEYSTGGMIFLKTHIHNTEISLGGITYARVIEIIDPYTVTFEDGQYAVNLVGANSNVGDKVNVNQVSVRSANSAGNTSSPAIEYASFNGGITYDVDSGNSGTFYPTGTPQLKVNNFKDAILIADYRGFDTIYFHSDATLGSDADFDNYIFKGLSHVNIQLTIEAEAEVRNVVIINCEIAGTLDGGNEVVNCVVKDINYLNGHIHDSGLNGTIILGGDGDAFIGNCKQIDIGINPIIDMGGSGQDLVMTDYTGIIQIKNLTGDNKIGIGISGGRVILDSTTVTAGIIHVSGNGKLLDENDNYISSGTWNNNVIIVNELSSSDTIKAGGKVFLDASSGNSGTGWPMGTERSPVDNLSDALIIAGFYGVDTIHISGSLIINGEDVTGIVFQSDRSLGNYITITSMINTGNCYFQDLTVNGVLTGGVRFTTCVLGALANFDGGAKNCLLTGDITITGAGANYFTECDTYVTSSITTHIYINNTALNIIRGRGRFGLYNKLSTNVTAIDLVSGFVYVDSTCIAGEVYVGGIGSIQDDSGENCIVKQAALNNVYLAAAIWDEPLTGTTHNLPTSAGRRLRAMANIVITEGDVTGATANTISLNGAASSEDGIYDPATISITEGTGYGQTRNILQYEGSTKTAIIDRNWKVIPDTNSIYTITANAGREHINEGLLRGVSGLEIILNERASPIDNAYKGQVLFIRSGTGEDQARRVISYNGATQTVTIGSAFPIDPDITSAYVMLPTGTITHKMISESVWDAEQEDHKTSKSFGDHVRRIKNQKI